MTDTFPSLDGFFRLSLDLLFIADADGRFLRLNPAFTELLGHAEEELLGRRVTDLVHPDDLKTAIEAFESLSVAGVDGEGLTGFECRVECADGSVRWLAWRAARDPGREGQPSGAIYGSAREITEDKEVDRLKDEFVSVVSHELRTPLTSIRGALDLVVGSGEDFSTQTERLLGIAKKNSQRLEMLVDDILDIEKIESGDLDFHPRVVDPTGVLEEVAEANASFAEQYEVRLEVRAVLHDESIRVDRDRLIQVLANFVSNAIKYSPEGGVVTLSGQPVFDGEAVRLAVTDRGEGIPEEFRDHLFERFTQADASTTRQKQGTGLGLSIAKALTEQMGGRIDYQTELGEGTSFYVDFPVVDRSSHDA